MELTAPLYLKHRKHLVFMATRMLNDKYLAQDAVQDAFIRFHFYPGKLYDDGHNILIQITKTICWDYLRYRLRWAFTDQVHDDVKATNESIESTLTVRDILRCSKSLSPKLNQVFILHWYKDIPKSEIGLRTNQKYSTVRWTYAEAIKQLKQKYETIPIKERPSPMQKRHYF